MRKKFISPLFNNEVEDICNRIKKKLFLRTYADIEKIIGCRNGYISKFNKKNIPMPMRWSIELIKLYQNKKEYKQKYFFFEKRKVKKTINNTKGIIKTSELLKKLMS